MLFILWDGKSRDGRDILKITEPYVGRRHTQVCKGGGRLELLSLCFGQKNGIAVFAGNTEAFGGLRLPHCTHGVCEEGNISALKVIKSCGAQLITCGMSAKSTVTASSITQSHALIALQRSLGPYTGHAAVPAELSVSLSRGYTPFAVTAATAVLLLGGIAPEAL